MTSETNQAVINLSEIFYSIQGEGRDQGRPCVFIRTAGCSLRCTYCDTKYAWEFNNPTPITEVLEKIREFPSKLVCVTGGDPLEEKNINLLLEELKNSDYEVIVETGGHMPIKNLTDRISIVLDIKTPGSGEEKNNLFENLEYLRNTDQVKFVITSHDDFKWSAGFYIENLAQFRGEVFFSPAYGKVTLKELAEWILKDGLDVRLHTQFHKEIWGEKRGH